MFRGRNKICVKAELHDTANGEAQSVSSKLKKLRTNGDDGNKTSGVTKKPEVLLGGHLWFTRQSRVSPKGSNDNCNGDRDPLQLRDTAKVTVLNNGGAVEGVLTRPV